MDNEDFPWLVGWYDQGLNFDLATAWGNTHFPEEFDFGRELQPPPSLDARIQYHSSDSGYTTSYSSNMGQETSQIVPSAQNSPSVTIPRPPQPTLESSPPRPASFGGWTAVNNQTSQSSQPTSLSYLNSAQENSTASRRVRNARSTRPPFQHPLKLETTRSFGGQALSPSPSASSLASPFIEASIQATPSARGDGSDGVATSPLSSQLYMTEDSESQAPSPKRQRTSQASATPTTPATAGRRAQKPRASATDTEAQLAAAGPSPAPPATGKRAKEDNSGRYTAAELQTLETAVHAYRDEHRMSQTAMNTLLNSNARHNDFPGGLWDQICAALPDRERHSIQKAVKRKFNNLKRGPWKPEDDEELTELYKLYPNKWQKIGEENNRGAEASRDRWRNYCKNGNAQEKGEWPKEQEDQLAKLMRNTIFALVQERINEIKAGRAVPAEFEPAELLDYGILSEQMGGTRSRLQCRNKFVKFQARDEKRMAYIFEPLKALEAFESQAVIQDSRSRPTSAKSKSMVAKSKARISEENEALKNYEKMLIGDKYYILTCISRAMNQAQVIDEASIPWDEIYDADNHTSWSIMDRKIVLKQMHEEYPAPEGMNCLDYVEGIIDIMENDHTDEALETHFYDRPRSTKRKRTYSTNDTKARKAIKTENAGSPAHSLPTPGSMQDEDED